MRRPALLLAFAVNFTSVGLAADPPPPPPPPAPSLDEAVRNAVAAGQVEDSDKIGVRASYRDVNGDGAVLVGMEVALAKKSDSEIPYAMRPIFRSGTREWPGKAAGDMEAEAVQRRVRVVAKPDYAVGGIWVRSGTGIDRVSLVYMRVRGNDLDPNDNYSSGWVGTSDGGSIQYVDGRGRPVVGLFADARGDQARSLGLVYAQVSPRRAKSKTPPADAPEEDWTDDGIVAVDEPVAGKKSNLELEAEAMRAQQDDGTGTGLLLLILLGAIAVPFAVIAYYVLGKKESETVDQAEKKEAAKRAESSKGSNRFGTRPAEERPELAKRLKPDLPETVTAMAMPTAVHLNRRPSEPVPGFFLVRATYRARRDRMTRIYVLAGEFLVIDAGRGADRNKAAGDAAAALVGGGLFGAMIGEQVAAMAADTQKTGGDALQQRLDRMDLAQLLAKASEEGNFRARFDDISSLSIDPPGQTRWGEMSRGIGTFRFRHQRRGEYSFDFLNGVEVRGAIELIRRTSQGERLHVGTDWDESTAVCLADLRIGS